MTCRTTTIAPANSILMMLKVLFINNLIVSFQIAQIKPTRSTITTSIGDEMSLEVTTTLDNENLRWRHNEARMSAWDGMKSVTITNVRKADEGIYECCEDGHREDGVHAIMRLIVRGETFIKLINREKKDFKIP